MHNIDHCQVEMNFHRFLAGLEIPFPFVSWVTFGCAKETYRGCDKYVHAQSQAAGRKPPKRLKAWHLKWANAMENPQSTLYVLGFFYATPHNQRRTMQRACKPRAAQNPTHPRYSAMLTREPTPAPVTKSATIWPVSGPAAGRIRIVPFFWLLSNMIRPINACLPDHGWKTTVLAPKKQNKC